MSKSLSTATGSAGFFSRAGFASGLTGAASAGTSSQMFSAGVGLGLLFISFSLFKTNQKLEHTLCVL